jgi:cytochrome P450
MGVTPISEAELPLVAMNDPAFWADVHPPLAAAREQASICRTKDGATYVLRLEQTEAVLKDPRFLAADLLAMQGLNSGPVWEWWSRVMFSRNPPDHTRLRRLVSRAFTPRSIEALRPRIAELTAALLAPAFDGEEIDIMASVAHALPAAVMAEMLAIPSHDHEVFRDWTTEIGLVFGAATDPAVRVRVEEALASLTEYVHRLIAERTAHPGDDLLSTLIQAEEGGDQLSAGELVDLLLNLLFAGHDTTRGAVGATFWLLARHPEQLDVVRADESLVPNAVDEILRYEPITFGTARQPNVGVELDGYLIPAGMPIAVCLVAASRDPRRYDRPDQFDVSRTDVRPPTFGAGIHYCLGAALAKVELEEVVRLTAALTSRIEQTADTAWAPFASIRRFDTLPVQLTMA